MGIEKDNLGFGIALDLDIDNMMKATRAITKSFNKIGKKFDALQKKSFSLGNSLQSISSIPISEKAKPSTNIAQRVEMPTSLSTDVLTPLEKIENEVVVLTSEFDNFDNVIIDVNKSFSNFSEESKDGLKKVSDRLSILTRISKVFRKRVGKDLKEVSKSWDELGESIKEAKYRLVAFTVAATDASLLDKRLTQISTSANLGIVSVRELTDSTISLSNDLGVTVGTTEEAIRYFSEYGKTLLTAGSITSEYGQETLKTAIQAEEAWGLSLDSTISLLDDLYRVMGLAPKEGRQYLEFLKGVSVATGQSSNELVNFSKDLIDVSVSLRGFITKKQLERATKFSGILNQMGGRSSDLLGMFQDLQSVVTLENQVETLGLLGLSIDKMRDLNVDQLGLELGKALKDSNSITKALVAQSGLGYDQQQALIRSWEKYNSLTIEQRNLEQDFIDVKNSLGESFQRLALVGRKMYLTLMIPLLNIMKPIINSVADFGESIIKFTGNLSYGTRSLLALVSTLFTLKMVFIPLTKTIFNFLTSIPGLTKTANLAFKFLFGTTIGEVGVKSMNALKIASAQAWAVVTSPITGILLGITAIGFVIYRLIKNWDNVKVAFLEGFELIKKGWGELTSYISTSIISKFNYVKDFLLDIVRTIGTSFKALVTGNFKVFGDGMKSLGTKLWEFITEPFRNAKEALLTISKAFGQVIRFDLDGAKATLGTLFTNAGGNGLQGALDLSKGLDEATRGVIDAVVPELGQITGAAVDVVGGVFKDIKGLFKSKADKDAQKDLEDDAKNFQSRNISGLFSGDSKFFVENKVQQALLEQNNKLMQQLVELTEKNGNKNATFINNSVTNQKITKNNSQPTSLRDQADLVKVK